jgi:hypothetical protein
MTQSDTLRLDALVTSPTNPRKNFNAIKLGMPICDAAFINE